MNPVQRPASTSDARKRRTEAQTYPECPDHKEVQHRDLRPPWCDTCGWNRGRPATPPQQVRDRP